MAKKHTDSDDCLDFTVILSSPLLAATQSWVVAEALDPCSKSSVNFARKFPVMGVSKTVALNEQFDIGVAGVNAVRNAVSTVRHRKESARPVPGAPILVVDDDLVIRKLLERLLLTDGYAVRVAGTRDQFIAVMKLMPSPSAILLDVSMPDMDGFEILWRLRQHVVGKFVPVIMVTAQSTPEDVKRGFSMGADGYLTKPVKVGTVRKALKAVWGIDEGH